MTHRELLALIEEAKLRTQGPAHEAMDALAEVIKERLGDTSEPPKEAA